LSKAAADSGVRDLRARGLSDGDVIGRAAAAVKLIDRPRAIRASNVGSLFQEGGPEGPLPRTGS